jgi:hypothetical protein
MKIPQAQVNYPCLLATFGGSLRQGLPASTTRFAATITVPTGSAVSTGVNESLRNSFAYQKYPIFGDVPSESL